MKINFKKIISLMTAAAISLSSVPLSFALSLSAEGEIEPIEPPFSTTTVDTNTQPSEPESSNTEPESSSTDPESSNTEPESSNTESESSNTEPESSSTDPESSNTEPESSNTEPESSEPEYPFEILDYKNKNISDDELLSLIEDKVFDECEGLDLSDNDITDISPLAILNNLKLLILKGNPIDTSKLEEFITALPDCEIVYGEPCLICPVCNPLCFENECDDCKCYCIPIPCAVCEYCNPDCLKGECDGCVCTCGSNFDDEVLILTDRLDAPDTPKFHALVLDEGGRVSFDFSHVNLGTNDPYWRVTLYETNAEKLSELTLSNIKEKGEQIISFQSLGDVTKVTKYVGMIPAGVYAFVIEQQNGGESWYKSDEYTLNVRLAVNSPETFEKIGILEVEDNDSEENATPIIFARPDIVTTPSTDDGGEEPDVPDNTDKDLDNTDNVPDDTDKDLDNTDDKDNDKDNDKTTDKEEDDEDKEIQPPLSGLFMRTRMIGNLHNGYDVDYYRLDLETDGLVSLRFRHNWLTEHDFKYENGKGDNPDAPFWHVSLYSEDGENILGDYYFNKLTPLGKEEDLFEYIGFIAAGTYYVKVTVDWEPEFWHSRCEYRLTFNYTENLGGFEVENNSTFETATTISEREVVGNLYLSNDVDCYTFSLDKSEVLFLNFRHARNAQPGAPYWNINVFHEELDKKGNIIYNNILSFAVTGDKQIENISLGKRPAGRYYVEITQSWKDEFWHNKDEYFLSFNFTYDEGIDHLKGDVNDNKNVDIDDALQIMMFLANMKASVLFDDEGEYAVDTRNWKAALITDFEAEAPTISDALEILMFLAGMEQSILNDYYNEMELK